MGVEPAGVQPARSWTVRRAAPGDRDAALELIRRAFRMQEVDRDAARVWDWIFVRNPSKARMHYVVADAGGRLAGQYAAMPVRLLHEQREVLGLVSLHTATDPDFERQGIFTRLARTLYDEARTEAPIVFGFPNPNSAPGFYQKLEWVELRPFPSLVRPLAHLRSVVRSWRPRWELAAAAGDLLAPLQTAFAKGVFAFERARGVEVLNLDRFPPWVDGLWNELSPTLGTCAIRDAEYLNWRFVDSPFSYRRFALQRSGRPRGFAVSAIRPWRGGKIAYLLELMAPLEDTAGARALVAAVIADSLAEGASGAYVIATRRQRHRRALIENGFLPVAGLVGLGQSFGVRANGPGIVSNKIMHADDWYISGADLDYV